VGIKRADGQKEGRRKGERIESKQGWTEGGEERKKYMKDGRKARKEGSI
jgi:hypothetical protein